MPDARRTTSNTSKLAEKVTTGRLSVRQTEALVRAARGPEGKGKAGATPGGKTPAVRDLETRLARKLGAKCEVRDKDGKGEIVVRYSSLDELDRLLELLL